MNPHCALTDTGPVAHCILFVDDQVRSRDFYRATLDKKERLDVPGMTEFELRSGLILGLMPRSSMRSLLGLVAGNHSSGSILSFPSRNGGFSEHKTTAPRCSAP